MKLNSELLRKLAKSFVFPFKISPFYMNFKVIGVKEKATIALFHP